MSIEAFLWNYQDGEPIGFEFATVRDLLATEDVDWNEEFGCLRVRFQNPSDSVDIYLGKEGPHTDHIDGITISRPITHPEFLDQIFRIMKLGDAMWFYSDETTPVFVRGADPNQYPPDLLKQLGEPRFVNSPAELLHQEP
ncbi:hypothetical protein [Thalassoroseus pseudoceratinae]|uniref:hypothetical protein n=1 Tax=Thalassoroseus pseudoceratinae TaxID=2713176 RepID=UPI0014249960|nr:hypothetical protein [Thalassoroseus pseudoceratinae]